MTPEEQAAIITAYQQRLADAEYREILTSVKLSSAHQRIAELEAAADPTEA
jgi:hypothetical protein